MAKPITITEANFRDEILSATLPAVIDLWAEWCSPCKLIAPHLKELADEYDGQIIIGKLDVDSNIGIATKYGIRSIPTLLFFKDGEMVDQIVGAVSKSTIKAKIENLLSRRFDLNY